MPRRNNNSIDLLKMMPSAFSEGQVHSFARGIAALVVTVVTFLFLTLFSNGVFAHLVNRAYVAPLVEVGINGLFDMVAIPVGIVRIFRSAVAVFLEELSR